MSSSKTQQLRQIKQEILDLKESPLYQYRQSHNYFPVIGEGSHEADIMLIGEAPGENEAETGRPFCGAAGRILDKLLNSAELKRDEVYVTNIVKDRPPGNRDPKPNEIELYAPFLLRQINIIQPGVLATLGRFSSRFILDSYGLSTEAGPMAAMHGQVFTADADYGLIQIVPLYHPAAALYNRSLLKTMKQDFQVLAAMVSLI